MTKGDNKADTDKILERLFRRSHKVAKAIVSPYPVSNQVSGENLSGEILHYMFCAEGTVTKGMIHLGKKPKEPISIELLLEDKTSGNSAFYSLEKQDTTIGFELPVRAGTRLTISIEGNGTDPVTEVWVSFLWIPTVKDAESKQFLISELEKVMEDDTDTE